MYRTSNFAPNSFRLAGVLVSVLLLTAFYIVAAVRRLPTIVNAANPPSAGHSIPNLA